MPDEQYIDFVEFVVKSLVDNPNDVKVEKSVDEMGVLLSLNINPADMGYVIGRKGQNARAIRTLLRLVGARNNARVNLKIVEPEGSERPPRREDGEAKERVNTPTETEEVDTSSIDDLKI
jgi:uncharacterized protein